jgi:hypothetical protein
VSKGSWLRATAFVPFSFILQIEIKKRADERTRTADLLITSELLYLLSYVGLFRAQSIP